jgi:hypothetical protein
VPKQSLKINKFEGGVNTSSSERALLDGESPLATNADTTSLGTLRAMGNGKANNLAFYDPNGVADPGYGLFTFSHDYDMLVGNTGAFKASPAATPTTYLCKATSTGIAIYDYTNKAWYDSNGSGGVTDIITFDDSSNDILPVFYIVDGALRVCDAQHPWEKVKWLGFINRSLFSSSGTAIDLTKWYSGDAQIWHTPVFQNSANYYLRNGSHSFWPGNDSAWVTTTINLYYAWDTSNAELATFNTGRSYQIYMSALYDDSKQEGELVEIGSIGHGNAATAKLKFGLAITPGASFANLTDRIRGFRVYIEDSLDAWGQIYQMLEVDLIRGVKKSGSPAFDRPWYYDGGTSSYWSEAGLDNDNCFVFEDMPVGNTYDAQNGHYPSEETKAGFKTATVIGRRVYIGGVTEQEGDDYSASSGKTSGDIMLKSPGNAFDKFPTLNKVEAVVNDGDEIVALANFGSKLLQFRKESMYVVAISGDDDILEGQFKHVGISKPYHLVTTAIGLFWINKLGLHWYSPEGKITNLIDKKLSLKTWDFQESSSIGYDALNNRLIISKSVLADGDSSGYKSKDIIMVDLKTMSFMFGMDAIDGGAKTNFVNAPDGKLIYAVDGSQVGYAKIDLSTYDLTYTFHGTLAKYNTSYGSSKWEYETYPWQLLGGTEGVKGMDPLGATERTVVVWDDTKHTCAASADQWVNYAGTSIDMDSVFEKGERYDIVDSLISNMNRTWMRNNATNTGESDYILNISPVGKIESGSAMNTMRDYVSQILGDVTFNTTETGTLQHLIDEADDSNANSSSPWTKDIDRGDGTDVTWTLTIDTWGNGDIDNVEFNLSVDEPFNSADFRVIGGSLMEWSDQPADTSDFTYYTKDIDFGNPAQGKRVGKVYVTFKSVSSKDAADDLPISTPSNVLARIHYKTEDGEYTADFDATNSKNYNATTGFAAETDTSEWTTAILIPNSTDINASAKTIPTKVLSAQLVFYTDEGKKTPGGFEISDITISYRTSPIK